MGISLALQALLVHFILFINLLLRQDLTFVLNSWVSVVLLELCTTVFSFLLFWGGHGLLCFFGGGKMARKLHGMWSKASKTKSKQNSKPYFRVLNNVKAF